MFVAVFAAVVLVAAARAHTSRCGVADVPDAVAEEVHALEVRFRERVCTGAGKNSIISFCPGGAKRVITIPTVVHLVDDEQGTINVTNQQILDNLAIMNDDFAGRPDNGNYTSTNFRFSLVEINYVVNNIWSNFGMGTGPLMKANLTVDPTNTFNWYIARLGGGVLGYSPFCFYGPQDSFIHGMTVHPDAIVGGAAVPYSDGQTATHEAGHHLGLFHAWQGGCSRQIGQQPDDICPQETNSRGCPEPAPASCGNPNCPDNIHNHMDYTEDACRWEFSPGQSEYMDMRIAMFHPGYLDGDVVDAIRAAAGASVWDDITAFQARMFETHKHEIF